MQLHERSLTIQFSTKSGATPGHDTKQPSGRVLLLTVALIALGIEIIATLLSPAMANDLTVGTRFDPNEAGFYELVAPCLICHAIDSTDPVGPTLNGVFGRRIASVRNYEYSAALFQKAAVGMIWDEANLNRFLESPRAMAPGNAMTYGGVPDAEDRARLITWLATGPVPLSAEALAAATPAPDPEVIAVLQVEADPQYGEYLAGKCLTCHLASGASGSIPPISGLPANYFIGAILEYQQGTRDNPIMRTMSDLLGAEELAALADYFAQPAP